MRIDDLAYVKTGLVLARKKAKSNEPTEEYKVLSLSNVNEDGSVRKDTFDTFQSSEVLEQQYFTIKGDVLLRLSYPFTAIYINDLLSGLLIPSSFAIIQVHNNEILPEFLTWYLNSETVKLELQRSQSGTRIPGTNKNVIRALELQEVTLEKQKAIIHITKLYSKEKALYEQLMDEKRKYTHAVVNQIMSS